MDAVVYGVAVSLGFSARENIDYILNYDAYGNYVGTYGINKTFTYNYVHAIASVIMGLFLSKTSLFFKSNCNKKSFSGNFNSVIQIL